MCDVIRCGYVNFNFDNSQNSKKEYVEELCKHIKVFLVHFEVVCWTGKFKENFCGHFAFKEIIVTKMFSSGKCIELENVKKFCFILYCGSWGFSLEIDFEPYYGFGLLLNWTFGELKRLHKVIVTWNVDTKF